VSTEARLIAEFAERQFQVREHRMVDRIDELEETIRQLRAVIAGGGMHFPIGWGLTPQETRMARAFALHSHRTTAQLMYAISPHPHDSSTNGCVRTVACRLKKKLPILRIESQHSSGYYIAPESQRFLKDAALR
jgi:hypothetical protein